jgi:hypothetical protein
VGKGCNIYNGSSNFNGPGCPLPLPGLGGVGTDLYGAPSNPLWTGWSGPRK